MAAARRVVLPPPGRNDYGFRLAGHTPVQILAVDPSSIADSCGLRAGDVVFMFNGADCSHATQQQLIQALRSSRGPIELLVRQMGRAQAQALRGQQMDVSGMSYMSARSGAPSYHSNHYSVRAHQPHPQPKVPFLNGGIGRYSRQPLLVLPLLQQYNGSDVLNHTHLIDANDLTEMTDEVLPVMYTEHVHETLQPVLDISAVSAAPSMDAMASDVEHQKAVQRTQTLAKRYAQMNADRKLTRQLQQDAKTNKLKKADAKTLQALLAGEEEQRKASADMPSEVNVVGRSGQSAFLNGTYRLKFVIDGRPIYKSRKALPQEVQAHAGRHLFLFFHEQNAAWSIGTDIGSLDVLAFNGDTSYSPDRIQGVWCIAERNKGYVEDPNIRVVMAMKKRVSFSDASGLPLYTSKPINADSPPNSRRGSIVEMPEERPAVASLQRRDLVISPTHDERDDIDVDDVMVEVQDDPIHDTITPPSPEMLETNFGASPQTRDARQQVATTTTATSAKNSSTVAAIAQQASQRSSAPAPSAEAVAARKASTTSTASTSSAVSTASSLGLSSTGGNSSNASPVMTTYDSVPEPITDDEEEGEDESDVVENVSFSAPASDFTPAPQVSATGFSRDRPGSATHLFASAGSDSSGGRARTSSSAADSEWAAAASPSSGKAAAKEAARIRKEMERQTRAMMRDQRRSSTSSRK